MEDNNTVSQDTIEGIDDFLPMPGAETVVTASDEPVDTKTEKQKQNIFAKSKPADLSFLDKEEETEEQKEDEEVDNEAEEPKVTAKTESSEGAADEIISEIDNEDFGLETETKSKASNSGYDAIFKSLIDDEVLLAFEDDKPIEEYTKKDWQELIKANFEEKERAIREQTPKEFFDALPEELQYAAMHVAQGNTNLKDVFAALARREEVRELDVTNVDHQEMIARQYLQATNFGSGDNDLIEDQIKEWVETGNIKKKATQFKPKLDKMQEKVLEADLKRQAEAQQKQVEQKEQYMNNIYETLKPAELNGLKLNSKRQNMLWNELTTVKYQSMTGRPTNLLGKLLEDYQFSDTPRYDLIAETLWLLQDPDDYKAAIRASVEKEIVGDTAKKLKTEEGRRLKSTVQANADEEKASRKPSKKTLSRKPGNIFKR
jgi:hypothetical protein